MPAEPRCYAPEEIRAGLTAEFERALDEETVLTFARVSGDFNPLHVDTDYATATNYGGRIVHGAAQVGLASAMAGMYLPGRDVLVGSIQARFPRALYYPCTVRVAGEITNWNAQNCWGTLRVTVREAATLATTAEITVGFTLHEKSAAPAPALRPTGSAVGRPASRPLVMVTGAAGGLGARLLEALAPEYALLAVTGRRGLDKGLRQATGAQEVAADLASGGWEERIAELAGESGLYGIIHAAWPGLPMGSLMELPEEVVIRQVLFAVQPTLRLAHLLARHAPASGGRLIVISSIAGGLRPALAMAAYSLGKAALEHAVRLLAPELARKNVCVNAVCPSLIPVGMHKEITDRQRLREAAAVPIGRLCQPEDVASLCRYLLSPAAAFVSGQVIGLTGAQL
jgi:3-oxoacyl-[acyl-carrier protein] reductase